MQASTLLELLCKGESVFLVGRTDMGINHISDLKGKTIGVALGTAGNFILANSLN